MHSSVLRWWSGQGLPYDLFMNPQLLLKITTIQMFSPPPASKQPRKATENSLPSPIPARDKDLFYESWLPWLESKMLIGISCIKSLSGAQQLPHHGENQEGAFLFSPKRTLSSLQLPFFFLSSVYDCGLLKRRMKGKVIWTWSRQMGYIILGHVVLSIPLSFIYRVVVNFQFQPAPTVFYCIFLRLNGACGGGSVYIFKCWNETTKLVFN